MQAKVLVTKGVVKSELDYGIGDAVSHIKFGRGVVKNIMDGGRDYEVTVDFEGYGVKKCLPLCKIKAYLILFGSEGRLCIRNSKNI